jgi:hypothetical protein
MREIGETLFAHQLHISTSFLFFVLRPMCKPIKRGRSIQEQ